jgi:hypothetical protein
MPLMAVLGRGISSVTIRTVGFGLPLYLGTIGTIQSFPAQGSRTEGYYIMDRQGRRIGVWYSSLTAGITVDPDSRQVMIATPWLQQ